MKLQNIYTMNDDIFIFHEQVASHFWGLGGSALPVDSLVFLRAKHSCWIGLLRYLLKRYILAMRIELSISEWIKTKPYSVSWKQSD